MTAGHSLVMGLAVPRSVRSFVLDYIIRIGMAFLTVTVGIGILTQYDSYFPPDFASHFLTGRDQYFWGWYSTAFFAHIVSSPIALFAGLFGFSKTILSRYPGAHRILGRVYVYLTLMVVVPSGLVMASKSFGGIAPSVSFLVLGVCTWFATFMGLVKAIRLDYVAHQVWMTRSFLMMFSAIVLRINEQLLRSFDTEMAYQINSWISWLPILLTFELTRCRSKPATETGTGSQQSSNSEPV